MRVNDSASQIRYVVYCRKPSCRRHCNQI